MFSGNILIKNVVADYHVIVGDSWTYQYEGYLGQGNLTAQVTSVSEPYGSVMGALYLNSSLIQSDEHFCNWIVFNDEVMEQIRDNGTTGTEIYGGLTRECILAWYDGSFYVIDIETGILLEKHSIDEEYILIDWNPTIEPGEWLLSGDEEWTYEVFQDETFLNTMGIEVMEVPEYPSTPIGMMYRNNSSPYNISLFNLYVFDNITIAQAAETSGISSGYYGGRECHYVVLDNFMESIFYIDNVTGIVLNITTDWGEQLILVDWSLASVAREPTKWLVSEGDEWIYDVLEYGYEREFGFKVTDVQEYPRSPIGDRYELGNMPQLGVLLSYEYVFDNATIGQAAETNGIFSGYYGGKECYYVVLDNGMGKTFYIDNATGIALNITTEWGDEYILVNWSVWGPPTWLVEVGEEWTYNIILNGDILSSMGIEVTSVPDYPDPPIGTIYYEGGPPEPDQDLFMYVYDNGTIESIASIAGTSSASYGGRQCEYVVLSYGSDYFINIDRATGIALSLTSISGTDIMQYILVNWSITSASSEEWVIETGDEWTYETQVGGMHQNFTGIVVTEVPSGLFYPPIGTIYSENSPPLENQYLILLGGIPMVIAKTSIEMLIGMYGTQSGTYGGRTCEYVTVNPLEGIIVKFDTATGVLLQLTNSTSSLDIILVAWSQLIGPNITINSPLETEAFNATAPAYDIWIEESELSAIWYVLNGGDPIYIPAINESSTGEINETAWNDLGDGLVEIIFYANDSIGNVRNARVTVLKDTQAPMISIKMPLTGQEFKSPPDFELQITETNVEKIWYTLNDGEPIEIFSESGTINETAWNELESGSVVIKFYVRDVVGSESFVEVEVVKLASTSPAPDTTVIVIIVVIGIVIGAAATVLLVGVVVNKRRH